MPYDAGIIINSAGVVKSKIESASIGQITGIKKAEHGHRAVGGMPPACPQEI
ncbi:MAG: hypothetical protein KAV00_03235 [Phycisphaerae bacterium]|nr:hypothetical protein [Phycisphaerae bacterium]